MRIERRPTAKNPPEWFAGDVWLDPIAAPDQPGQQAAAGVVRFAPGARTAWHSHPGGQTLHVLDGVALIGTRGASAIVRAGDTVVCPPDEEHWHGAAADSFMVHVAVWDVLPQRPAAIWGDHVTDAEYRHAVESAPS